MTTYIYQRPGWPKFHWSDAEIAPLLLDARQRQGRLLGRMEALGLALTAEAALRALTEEALKTSAIEGEAIDREQLRSSFARRLGIDGGAPVAAGRDVEGLVDMLLDATQRFEAPLTPARLFSWHESLFPAEKGAMGRLRSGTWRDDARGPMQVVSGAIGRERVHFQAPSAAALSAETEAFFSWFNAPGRLDPVVKAALAHLWFVTIHPFDDGNGRIARAIAELALARADATSRRFYSMSGQIRAERKSYYETLERTQKGSLDVTLWLAWFLKCLTRAIEGADALLASLLEKARFWRTHAGVSFNARQVAMLNRLLDGFVGALTTSKWGKIAKCSQDTALRDIEGLVRLGVLAKGPEGGRSTNYSLRKD